MTGCTATIRREPVEEIIETLQNSPGGQRGKFVILAARTGGTAGGIQAAQEYAQEHGLMGFTGNQILMVAGLYRHGCQSR